MNNTDYVLISSVIGALLCLVLYLQRRRARRMKEFKG